MAAFDLDGRVVAISGAASGIGRAAALLLAEHGAEVTIGDLDADGGEATAAEIRARGGSAAFVPVDVSDSAAVRAWLDAAAAPRGGIDAIVNNAGLQRSGPVTELPEETWDALMRVNPRSCFLGVKHGVPHLLARGGGAIVNTASLAGVKGGPGNTAYAASKGAIVAFTRAVAAELGPQGIRVNALCPGWVDTPFNDPVIAAMGGAQAQAEMVAAAVPLRRQATPEEIAGTVVYLVSDASSYVTGQAVVVDGGVY